MDLRRPAFRTTLALLLPVVAAVTVAGQPADAAVVTTTHTGSGAPALAQVGDRLYVAWTGSSGTATAKDMIVGYSTDKGQHIVKLSSGERSPQNEGLALVADPDSSGILVAWADGRARNTLTMTSYSGTAFSCRTSFTGITTSHAPALAVDSSGRTYVAWTDAARHLNIALIIPDTCATTHVMTMVNRTVLSQTCLSSAPSDLYIAFRGSDNHEYLGYSEGCFPTGFLPADTGTVVTSPIGSLASGYVNSYFNAAADLVVSSLF